MNPREEISLDMDATRNGVRYEIEVRLWNRPFLRYLTGSSLSSLGDQFYFVALPWLILQLTGSAAIMGSIFMVAAIPRSLFMLVGGAISDHISPRLIVIYSAFARAFAVTVIGILLRIHVLTIIELYVLSFVFGTSDAFSMPANEKYFPSLVPEQHLEKAYSIYQGVSRAISIASPAPAAIVIRTLGVFWAFFVDAVSFLFIPAALFSLPDRRSEQNPTNTLRLWTAIGEGFQYVRQDTPLFVLISMAAIINLFFFGPLFVGFPYLAKTAFGSPTAYGIWVSSFSAGGLIGIIAAGSLKVRRVGLLIVGIGTLSGVCLGGVAFLSDVWTISCDAFLMGAASGFVNVQLSAWFQRRISEVVRGRVMSVVDLVTGGLFPLSLALAGICASWSVKMTFILGGVGTVIGATGAMLSRSVREVA
jgi:MFS family permease